MIAVDTSVLICLLREEPETPRFLAILLRETGHLCISAANYVEAGIVIDSNRDDGLSARLDRLIDHFAIDIVAVTHDHARIARQAYRLFGKGYHAAALNYGDCFAYALARSEAAPLLYNGNDFAQTDIAAAA